jgi:hypothetical protein
MDAPSNFTFVKFKGTPERRGKGCDAISRSIIRSHAMQQVWEQRRLEYAKNHGKGKFEIVLENERVDGTENLTTPSRQRRLGSVATSSTKGAKVNQGHKARPLTSPDELSDGSAYPFGNDHASKRFSGTSSHSLSPTESFSTTSSPSEQRLRSCKGYSQASAVLPGTVSPSAIGMGVMDPFHTCAVSFGPKESRYMNHCEPLLRSNCVLPIPRISFLMLPPIALIYTTRERQLGSSYCS